MEGPMENPATGQSPIANQKSPITKKKSTGPRTAAGKQRSSQNARKHGLFSTAGFFWDAAIALGEDPQEFGRLLKGLVLARPPADTLEMVIRLLEEMQEKRKKEERLLVDDFKPSLLRNPSQAPHGGGGACNRKKILNRGNELKSLLKTKGITETTHSKRTPFSPAKTAVKAKKIGISMQETSGDARSLAASGPSPVHKEQVGTTSPHQSGPG